MKNGLAFLLFSFSAMALASHSIGEKADYQLDKSSNRTSSMIKSGTMSAALTNYDAAHTDGPSFEVTLNYSFDVAFMGKQVGTEVTWFEETYFTEEYLEKLRTDKKVVSSNFTAEHQGFEDAKNLDGNFYPHCDVIHFTDIKQTVVEQFRGILGAVFASYRAQQDLDDMEVTARIYSQVPVIGAVKIDVSGSYSGFPVKAGGDYKAP